MSARPMNRKRERDQTSRFGTQGVRKLWRYVKTPAFESPDNARDESDSIKSRVVIASSRGVRPSLQGLLTPALGSKGRTELPTEKRAQSDTVEGLTGDDHAKEDGLGCTETERSSDQPITLMQHTEMAALSKPPSTRRLIKYASKSSGFENARLRHIQESGINVTPEKTASSAEVSQESPPDFAVAGQATLGVQGTEAPLAAQGPTPTQQEVQEQTETRQEEETKGDLEAAPEIQRIKEALNEESTAKEVPKEPNASESLKEENAESMPQEVSITESIPLESKNVTRSEKRKARLDKRKAKIVKVLGKAVAKSEEQTKDGKQGAALLSGIKRIDATKLKISTLDVGPQAPIPRLWHGLDRVLFNPGVYHLQDPRSRVYNFDPYVESIMPVSEFDFSAIPGFVTSSKDKTLEQLAKQTGKRYLGSSSSLTGILSTFHFLISQWRPLTIDTISRSFTENNSNFTVLVRGPAAACLRWRDGTYALDSDKTYDTENVLSYLGQSMERFLTRSPEAFEKFRKANSAQLTEEERNEPTAHRYSTLGKILMRSQLDAQDDRLPGTGVFDLKTRAVVTVRMNAKRYEDLRGYEIQRRFGEWESFEREYYDMIRAAFLKYSLQVRLGGMDGIFVAFHNTTRVFGFQYIPLEEMDLALHGQTDPALGDQELRLSLEMLNDVLDRVTARFPKQTLRLHFETRPSEKAFMYIFAEPVPDEVIERERAAKDESLQATMHSVARAASKDGAAAGASEPEERATQAEEASGRPWGLQELPALFNSSPTEAPSAAEVSPPDPATDTRPDSPSEPTKGKPVTNGRKATAADPTSADNNSPLLVLKLTVRNRLDGQSVERPTGLETRPPRAPGPTWTLEYGLREPATGASARRLYAMCRERRRKLLSEEAKNMQYIVDRMMELSQRGERFREDIEKKARKEGGGRVVYGK